MKRLFKLVVVLLVLLIVAAVAVVVYIDRIAKTAIEEGATYALGVQTTVGAADVKLLGGTFEMRELNVANPSGYDAPQFLRMGDGGVAVTLGSLREETVELPTLALRDIDVSIEKNAQGANYQVILDNLKRLESGGGDAAPSEGGKKFVIREVAIEDVNVSVNVLPIGGSLTKVDVPIPEIRLQDVGSDSDSGVLLSELTNIVIKAILAELVRVGGDQLPALLTNELSGALAQLEGISQFGLDQIDQISSEVTSTIEGVAGEAGKVTEGIDEIGREIEKVGEGLGGLFGGKKDDE